jgi:hypothetical protein
MTKIYKFEVVAPFNGRRIVISRHMTLKAALAAAGKYHGPGVEVVPV